MMHAPSGAEYEVFEDPSAMADAFARTMAERARHEVEQHGVFNLALTGGKTPKTLYARVAGPEHRAAAPWGRVKIFFGDERAVGPDHSESNFGMAWESWLKHGTIPRTQIFRMEGEDPDLPAAAARYSQHLTREIARTTGGFPMLDLLLLGLGEDGHVASLFPNTAALDETLRLVVANEVPQQGTRRLTITYPVIEAAAEVWFMVSGRNKAHVAAQVLGFIPGGEMLPAALAHPASGRIRWWLDREAASEFPR